MADERVKLALLQGVGERRDLQCCKMETKGVAEGKTYTD